MKNLRANESKIFGVFGLFLALIAPVFMLLLFRSQNQWLAILLLVMIPFSAAIAWFGFRAKFVAVDGDELITENEAKSYERISLSSIASVRTIPLPYRLGVLFFRTEKSSIMTIVREQDLTWIMSRMPLASITPYWRNRIG